MWVLSFELVPLAKPDDSKVVRTRHFAIVSGTEGRRDTIEVRMVEDIGSIGAELEHVPLRYMEVL
jgi:hypothetical protein